MSNSAYKSKAKAMGVKSTFNIGGETVITTFGKGNDAIVEKKVVDNVIENISPAQSVDIKVIEPKNEAYNIVKGRVSFPKESPSVIYQPQKSGIYIKVGNKEISYQDELEKKFYGKNFNDNIHIQLIYEILDLEKDLAVYSNTASFLVDNIFAVDSGDEDADIFTYLSTSNTYNTFRNAEKVIPAFAKNVVPIRNKFDALLDIRSDYNKKKRAENARLSYYGSIFYDGKGRLRSDRDIYNSLAILGALRNFVTDSVDNEKVSAIIYNLNMLDNSFLKTLDSILNEAVDAINKDFIKNNKVNYFILYSSYNCFRDYEIKNRITSEFYDFSIKKSYKNLGFSIKALREAVIEKHCADVKDKKYDSCRSKLYQLLDFVIYDYYINNPALIENIVAQLRATKKEEDKEALYSGEAKAFYSQNKKLFDNIIFKTSPSSIGKIDPEKVYVFDKCINMLDSKRFDYFSKLIYVLTLYLDGKQINELLTSLIHSFDNINSFKDVLDELGFEDEFVDPYKFFNFGRTKRIAQELRIINSFAKMKATSPNFKKAQYIDAMVILGTDMSAGELSEEADAFLDINAKNHNVRNFLANNVLNSNRYKYLIRYIRPSMAKAVAANKNIVLHVLGDIPETQIKRYYDSVFAVHIVDREHLDKAGNPIQKNIPPKKASLEEMQSKLCSVIMDICYDDFRDVNQKVKRGTQQELDKERKKAAIRLYLTVVYIFVKNMVQINARYVIAFHCLERDCKIFGYNLRDKKTDDNGKPVYNKNYHFLTKAYINTANTLYNAELDKPFKQRNKVKRPINQRFCRILINDMTFRSPSENCLDNYYSDSSLRSCKREMLENEMIGDNASLLQSLTREFRNNVAHLSMLRTFDKQIDADNQNKAPMVNQLGRFSTYFEAYHFLVQMQLAGSEQRCGNRRINQYEEVAALERWLKNGTYSKNTVKSLCTPFGYNLIRYKNLSINELFDKNKPLPQKD